MEPLLRALVPLVSLAAFWTWESRRPFFGPAPGRWRHAVANLGLALLNTIFLSFVLATAVAWTVEQRGGGANGIGTLPPMLSFGLTFLVLDLGMYAWHRANHRVPLLWRFHRVHHSDPHMDVTTATRFHIGEHLGAFCVRILLVLTFGFELLPLVVYDLTLIVMTQLHHADISLGRFDSPLRRLVVTPDMHKTHHSDRPSETDSNYSVVFSIWDRLFGTHLVTEDPHRIRFGLRGWRAPGLQTIAGMLRTPFLATPPPTDAARAHPRSGRPPATSAGSRSPHPPPR